MVLETRGREWEEHDGNLYSMRCDALARGCPFDGVGANGREQGENGGLSGGLDMVVRRDLTRAFRKEVN